MLKKKREKIITAKKDNPRKIELLCLKNRFGVSTYNALFNYYPQFDYFDPVLSNTDLCDPDLILEYDKDGAIDIPERYKFKVPFD